MSTKVRKELVSESDNVSMEKENEFICISTDIKKKSISDNVSTKLKKQQCISA